MQRFVWRGYRYGIFRVKHDRKGKYNRVFGKFEGFDEVLSRIPHRICESFHVFEESPESKKALDVFRNKICLKKKTGYPNKSIYG